MAHPSASALALVEEFPRITRVLMPTTSVMVVWISVLLIVIFCGVGVLIGCGMAGVPAIVKWLLKFKVISVPVFPNFVTILVMRLSLIGVFVLIIILSGCAPSNTLSVTPSLPERILSETLPSPTMAISTSTSTLTPTATITATMDADPFIDPLNLSNPGQLMEMISNPFHLPSAGSDDPHQGVDFSDIQPELGYAQSGMNVYSILNGQVVSVIKDRFPYGNAIMVATRLSELPMDWQIILDGDSQPEAWPKTSALSCPTGWDRKVAEEPDLFLWVLYAHMLNPPEFKVGDALKSGDLIGQIGMSGNALAGAVQKVEAAPLHF